LWHLSNPNRSQNTSSWRQRRNYHWRRTNEPRKARDSNKETLHPCTIKRSRCKENWPRYWWTWEDNDHQCSPLG
jgi:hypothetical protein